MGLYQTLPDHVSEVDVIIAGGGTAGCIIASRLAQADSNLHILLLETGPNNYNDPSIIHPGLFFGHLMPDSKHTLFYPSKPSPHLAGRAPVIPAGGTLGGGSSINMCMYSRAQRSDFDDWKMDGWSAEDMLPYMRKFETYHGRGKDTLHGYDGPVGVSSGTYRGIASENDFIEAAQKAGWPEVEDLQTMDTVNAVARALRYVSPEGLRQDTAHRYLHPLLQGKSHPNLQVVTESQVLRITVEDRVATGVVFRANPKFHPDNDAERTVYAKKLVVVSCGAMGTPLLLERSGIGKPEVLSEAGVSLVAENQGVGVGFQDHHLMSYAYKTNLDPDDTLNGIVFGTSNPADLIKTKSKTLGYNGQDASGKLRPTNEEAAELGPAFNDVWNTHFKNKPDKPVVGMALINTMPGLPPEGVPYGAYLGITMFTLYPLSRGHVHITGPKIDDSIDFETGFLSDEQGIDVKQHIWAYKKQREIMRRMRCYRGEVPEWNPPFLPGSSSALVSVDEPLPDNVPDIVYSAKDDDILADYIRNKVDTTWHSMGTCRMAPQNEGGAVDGSLSVYGVSKLKIADLSIPPSNVGANTTNTAIAIGEKASNIFLRELGLLK